MEHKQQKKLILSLLKKYKTYVKNAIHEKGDMKKTSVDEFNEINRVIIELLEEIN